MLTRRAFLATASAALTAACLPDRPAGSIRIASGDRGGLYVAVCEIFAQRLRVRHPGIDVTVLPTAGSVENLRLLRSGQADIGLAQADMIQLDRERGPADTDPAALARVYENYLQVVVPARSPILVLDHLAGLNVSVGLTDSGVEASSDMLFAAAGLDHRIHRVNLSLRDALAALADQRIDALVWSGGIPTPVISELNMALPLRILDLSPWVEPMTRITSYPYLLPRAPAGSYVPPNTHTIGTPDLLVCRPGLSNALAAGCVEVLASDTAELMPPDVRGLQYLHPPSMIQTGRIPLHPGAIEAYRQLHG